MHKDIPETIEATGGEYCTALSIVKLGYSITGNSYDVMDLWNATPKQYDQNGRVTGAIPLDTIKTAINRGLLNITTGQYDKLWDNWYKPKDIQKEMDICQSACMVDGYWYYNWVGLAPNTVLTIPVSTAYTEHSYIVKDWVNGQAIVDAHLGYDLDMPLNVLNSEINDAGCDCYILTNPTINARREISILQYILELYQQLILAFQKKSIIIQPINNQSNMDNQPIVNQPTQAIKYPRIVAWANAIKLAEGWSPTSVSCLNNNPGNLGYTTLTASWGGMKSGAKDDGGFFCKFKDYDTGFQALCNFLVLGAEDELKAFHQARTLGEFSSVYGNTGLGYGQQIANILNVPLNSDISTFLS